MVKRLADGRRVVAPVAPGAADLTREGGHAPGVVEQVPAGHLPLARGAAPLGQGDQHAAALRQNGLDQLRVLERRGHALDLQGELLVVY